MLDILMRTYKKGAFDFGPGNSMSSDGKDGIFRLTRDQGKNLSQSVVWPPYLSNIEQGRTIDPHSIRLMPVKFLRLFLGSFTRPGHAGLFQAVGVVGGKALHGLALLLGHEVPQGGSVLVAHDDCLLIALPYGITWPRKENLDLRALDKAH